MTQIIVSPLGNDTQDGGELTPLLTVNRAIAVALPGDSIVVRGTITGQTVTVNKAGVANAPISIIQHADGGTIDGEFIWPKVPANAVIMKSPTGVIGHYGPLVNITASHIVWSVDVCNSLGRGVGVTGDYVTLIGCSVDMCRNACINAQDCKSIVIQGVKWSHGGSYYQAQRNPAQYNWPVCCHLLRVTDGWVEGCEGFENWGEGLAAGRGCTNVLFLNNKLWDNLSVNLYFDRVNKSTAAGNHISCTGNTLPCEGISLRNETYGGEQTPPLADVSIERNVIVGCSKGVVLGRSEKAGELMQRVRIQRNTVVNSTITNLFTNAADHRSITIAENIFYQYDGLQAQVSGIQPGQYTFSRNAWVGVYAPSDVVISASDVHGVSLDVDYAPLEDYGIGAIDYIAPPPPVDPPIPDALVKIIFAAKMSASEAAELGRLLDGKTFTMMVD